MTQIKNRMSKRDNLAIALNLVLSLGSAYEYGIRAKRIYLVLGLVCFFVACFLYFECLRRLRRGERL